MHATRNLITSSGPNLPLQTRTVLVVEDEDLVRDMIVCELADAGYAVIEAGTAEEGRDVLDTQPVAALFTDIRLPGKMDGWQLAEQARALNPRLPIIYATGFSVEAPRMVPGGVFLRKPYLPSTVIEALERLLDTDRD